MLTETTEYARDVAKNNKLDSVVYSLNVTLSATESEVEAWLQKRDAEVRRTTLVNMRNSINTSLNPFTGDTAQDVVNQINNVLDGEEYLCRLTQEKTK